MSSVGQAIVDSWPMLSAGYRIGVVVDALNRGETSLRELESCLATAPRLRGRRELRRILALFAAGCRSPLEIWGATDVFTGQVLRRLERQVPV